jgi:hypothetical protein
MRFFFFLIVSSSFACGGQITGDDSGIDAHGDATNAPDASIDSSICIDIEPGNFDTSCGGDTDCIQIASGTLCSSSSGQAPCLCPTASISATDESKYQAQLKTIEQGGAVGCGCPLLGTPHCIQTQCVFCPNPEIKPSSIPPGCPDGGN